MIMKPADIVTTLEQSDEYALWKSKNPRCFLAHIFIEQKNTQVGYFDPDKTTITTFVLGEKSSVIPDQEILKGDSDVVELDIAQVILSPDDATNRATAILKEQYGHPTVLKSFVIIQNLQGTVLYNVTFFSQSFKAFNVKIGAGDGRVLHHSEISLAQSAK